MTMNESQPPPPPYVEKPISNGIDRQPPPPQVFPRFPPNALTIRLATKEELIQVRTATYTSWGKSRMSLEQYLRRGTGEWQPTLMDVLQPAML